MTKKPTSMEELATLTTLNTIYSGFGLATAIHFPCAFCAEPDVMACKIVDTRQAMEKGAQCKSCGRGWKAVFSTPDGAPEIRFEIVQTVGPDQPDWFTPKMRRVDQ